MASAGCGECSCFCPEKDIGVLVEPSTKGRKYGVLVALFPYMHSASYNGASTLEALHKPIECVSNEENPQRKHQKNFSHLSPKSGILRNAPLTTRKSRPGRERNRLGQRSTSTQTCLPGWPSKVPFRGLLHQTAAGDHPAWRGTKASCMTQGQENRRNSWLLVDVFMLLLVSQVE